MNNLIALGSEQKSFSVKSNRVDIEFEKTFFENSIPYISYDNLENQLKTFFGKFSDQSENILYPDISIINSSDLLRELYKTKLNDMAINEINYNMNK